MIVEPNSRLAPVYQCKECFEYKKVYSIRMDTEQTGCRHIICTQPAAGSKTHGDPFLQFQII
uniref:Uncharacterized protein n=1 Tax=Anguilla anguilla TaxID=7936 RepID=A0A0E9UJ09_ANGAN